MTFEIYYSDYESDNGSTDNICKSNLKSEYDFRDIFNCYENLDLTLPLNNNDIIKLNMMKFPELELPKKNKSRFTNKFNFNFITKIKKLLLK